MKTSLRNLARRWWPVLPSLLLCLFVYHDVGRYAFVNFDDDFYVRDNPRVTEGLGVDAAGWALTTGHAGVWIPATWLSFQLDATLFGPGPAGFHRTNLWLHLLNVVLVLALARRLGLAPAPALLAATLFGVHPLNVEAVAWVTARKDLLMTAFLLGAALAWLGLSPRRRQLVGGPLAVLAMLAKPAAVVAPVLLALVGRRRAMGGDGVARPAARREWIAVLPWFLASAGVAVVTWRLARSAEFGAPVTTPLPARLAAATTGVFRYLGKLVWPHDLAVRYPDADLQVAAVWVVLAALALAGLTFAAWRGRRRAPLAAFGWGWFLACLAPSLGVVQGGQLPMGDRYAYAAGSGLFIAVAGLAWNAAAGRWRGRGRWLVLGPALVLVGVGAVAARGQAVLWREPTALWRHALAVTGDNDVAHMNLGVLLEAAGRPEEALKHLEAALAIKPRSETHYNAGNVCGKLGRAADAERHYRQTLRLDPGRAEAALNLGALLGQQGRLPEAREVLLAAAVRRPESASVQYNLAAVAWLQGDFAEARLRCAQTLEREPGHAGARELSARLRTAAPAR
jgi:tetratricopeptide (TPR) repeat protein